MARKKARTPTVDPATASFEEAVHFLQQHPMFEPLIWRAQILRHDGNLCPSGGWAVLAVHGQIHPHPRWRADPEEWIYILAHCLLHLGLGHTEPRGPARVWNVACDVFIAQFLRELKLGRPPAGIDTHVDLPSGSEEEICSRLVEGGIPDRLLTFGTAGRGVMDLVSPTVLPRWVRPAAEWQRWFGAGLRQAVTSAVNVAAGITDSLGVDVDRASPSARARVWFMSSYPLLGSLATAFTIVEDPVLCARLDISVAAVNAERGELYINPGAGLDEEECRFVMAHELMHVALRHQARRQGRDPDLWNAACDYVINGWLVEMSVGQMPRMGVLHDEQLAGQSAESIYDMMVTDMRRYRKLATLRGVGASDMLEPGRPDWWTQSDGMELDEYYRRCLSQGLQFHETQGRGFLPEGLIEEIRALSQPPIPWDVGLARWFDDYFRPLEERRSYARPSRRQASSQDIPRPRWVPDWDAEDGRTFGVVLDTSGSMDRELLGKALGAIASYAVSRDVPAVRVVYCDAAPYDQGYVEPQAIGDRVEVKGRGGTVLQPGIDLIERADDFPKDGPILIITDGYCDPLRVHRPHAYLMPEGHRLPFVPRSRVFAVS
jgi:predicted metal-dependent peptidase